MPPDDSSLPSSTSLSQTQALVTRHSPCFPDSSLGPQKLSAAFPEMLLNLLLIPFAWKFPWIYPTMLTRCWLLGVSCSETESGAPAFHAFRFYLIVSEVGIASRVPTLGQIRGVRDASPLGIQVASPPKAWFPLTPSPNASPNFRGSFVSYPLEREKKLPLC